LTSDQLNFFNSAKGVFNTVDAPPAPGGLGPLFNLDSCGGCHSQPAAGGSGGLPNPQVAVATAMGATNTVPSFITANGPVREARFIRNPDGSPDGSVHDLYTITGRSDASGCKISQPNFAAAISQNNIIFRIPTPTFGLGLVEAVPDAGLQSAVAAVAKQRSALGISGHFNTSSNDGTITRFGWKAQNKSLSIFAGEAYNVEMGVTNELFPNERNTTQGCVLNATPEDATNFSNDSNSGSDGSDFSSDVVNFAMFMRLLAAPTPAGATPAATPTASSSSTTTTGQASAAAPATTADATITTDPATTAAPATAAATTTASTTAAAPATSTPIQVASASADSVLPAAAADATAATPSTAATASTATAASTSAASVTRGQQVFANVGCSACHLPSQTTGMAALAASNSTFSPLSDFAVHAMGTGLADNVTQGNAVGNQFRTAPLWGVGQRIFFLHDGRTNDLKVAITQHASQGSEANQVVQNFNLLSTTDQQSLLNYLRSL
jgi:CxxC motif-containing protein (DUF1111 family)